MVMTEQPDLLEWQPPTVFHGDTFDQARDGQRLSEQCTRVFNIMKSGQWHTLASLSMATGDPQASVSARLRDLRKHGFKVEREYVAHGLHRYRMVKS